MIWKYIVTYFVIILTPVIKKSGNDSVEVIGIKIPPNTYYIELEEDTLSKKVAFYDRIGAIDYIEARDPKKDFDTIDNYKIWFTLDSIKIKNQP